MSDGLFADTKEHIGEFTVAGSDGPEEAPDRAGEESAACLHLKVEIAPFLNRNPL